MASVDCPRRLIVNADDFGRSQSVNEAVVLAHSDGILTTASLMVAGTAASEAVECARKLPKLGVGLHLTLACGRSVLPHHEIPDLVRPSGEFDDNATRAGLRYFSVPGLSRSLEREIAAQFEVFARTGLQLDHVNGHLNLHLHPTVFRILIQNAERWGIRSIRVTDDPFWHNARLAGGRWSYRISHAFIFSVLAARARRRLARQSIRYTDRVFGLLQDSRVDEAFLSQCLECLPPGDSELYCHPSTGQFRHELLALTSSRIREQIARAQINLIRYQDLAQEP